LRLNELLVGMLLKIQLKAILIFEKPWYYYGIIIDVRRKI